MARPTRIAYGHALTSEGASAARAEELQQLCEISRRQPESGRRSGGGSAWRVRALLRALPIGAEANDFRERATLQLLNHPRFVDFDGARADRETLRDLLVLQPR